ncbi:MAG: DNA-binding response OmpR family regulator [Candidatus Paceibacteria bacterium]
MPDAKACFDAGMDDYMAKPIDADMLFEKLSKWVSSNNPPSVTGEVKMQEPEAPVDQTLVGQRMAIWGKDALYTRIRPKH